MGVFARINGEPHWSLSGLSTQEDSTPLDPADMSGGVGQISFKMPGGVPPSSIRFAEIEIDSTVRGLTRGVVSTFGDTAGVVSVTALSRMSALNVERNMAPFHGTLGGLLTYWVELCGITEGFIIESAIASRPVTSLGRFANVWERIKMLCAAERIEASLVQGEIVFRRARQNTAQMFRNEAPQRVFDDGDLAQKVTVAYYERSWKAAGLAWPVGGWNMDTRSFQVDAGEVLEEELRLQDDDGNGVSLLSVQQPVCVASVSRTYASSSVYAVAGNDGLMISPAQWADLGGKVEVTVSEDTRTLNLKITAPTEEHYAPYRLMMPTSTSDGYSSLRIVGEGLFYARKDLTLLAHNDVEHAPREFGAEVDADAFATMEQAWRAGLVTAMRYSGPAKSLTMTSRDIGQGYGDIAGARVFFGGGVYRVRSASIQQKQRLSAEMDTLLGDLNRAWAGRTIGMWNEFWAGKTLGDVSLTPLANPGLVASNVWPDLWYPDQVYPA